MSSEYASASFVILVIPLPFLSIIKFSMSWICFENKTGDTFLLDVLQGYDRRKVRFYHAILLSKTFQKSFWEGNVEYSFLKPGPPSPKKIQITQLSPQLKSWKKSACIRDQNSDLRRSIYPRKVGNGGAGLTSFLNLLIVFWHTKALFDRSMKNRFWEMTSISPSNYFIWMF